MSRSLRIITDAVHLRIKACTVRLDLIDLVSLIRDKPRTCAPDAEKACVSSPHPPRKDCSNHDNQRKEQCGNASNADVKSASMIHSRVPVLRHSVWKMDAMESWQPRPGRNP